jgi:lipopolysaccharide transport system permease protein
MELIRSVWRFRHFILRKTRNDIRAQFSRSGIGYLWLILTPAALIATYIFIFSEIMKAKLPGVDDTLAYGVYLSAGIVFWTSFSNTLSRLTQVFIAEKNLLREVYVPSSILPICVLAAETFQLILFLGVFLVFLVLVESIPGLEVLYLLPVLAVQYALVLGVGLILGILNTFMRDFGHSLAIVLHFWFWLTPIVYPIEILPDWARLVIGRFNPMTPVIEGYHAIFVFHRAVDLWSLLPTAILALVLLGAGLWMFRRTSGALGDLA